MRPSSVIVNVAVDQGGVVETVNRVTSHDKPVYETHSVLHYAVANICLLYKADAADASLCGDLCV